LLRGPVIVSVDTSSKYFRLYGGGVMRNINGINVCGQQVNHSILAIGFGYDDKSGQNYLILKNSWGTHWGENGYMRITLDNPSDLGQCGILYQMI
jgi:C1A family cysteine protease